MECRSRRLVLFHVPDVRLLPPLHRRYSRRQVRLWPNGHHRYLDHVPGLPLIVLPLGQRYHGDDRHHRCIGADLYGNGTVQR